MSALVTAFVFVWLGIIAYLLRLHAGQRRLEQVAASLQRQLGETQPW